MLRVSASLLRRGAAATRPIAAVRATRRLAAPTLLELVKQLRKETNAGIADCREALVSAGLDVARAKVLLQEKAQQTAAKKAVRVAAEGVVAAAVRGDARRAVLLELNCETDFAA